MLPTVWADYPRLVPDVLIASDSQHVRDEIRSMLSGRPDMSIREVASGAAVRAVVADDEPDLVIVDQQSGNMGGIATCLDLRLEEGADRIVHVPVLLLLDRRADVFLAKRAGAEGFILKPLDPIRLRKAVTALLAGDTYHDDSYRPVGVAGGA